MAECQQCVKLRQEIASMQEILEHNMGVSNKAARAFQRERDQIIRRLRERHSAIEIAEATGLTRQRIHQILNEPETSGNAGEQK